MDAETPKRLFDLGGTRARQDWLSALGAYALAEEIKRYWAQRGALVATKVEQIKMTTGPEGDNVKILYGVRSSLVRGLPQGWNAEKLMRAERT